MKKIATLLLTLAMLFCFVGCNEIVSEKPIDVEFNFSYDAMETEYVYKYDWWNGEFKYLPEVKMVHHDAEYKVLYERVWENGYTDTIWVTVSKAEYDNALQEIEKVG